MVPAITKGRSGIVKKDSCQAVNQYTYNLSSLLMERASVQCCHLYVIYCTIVQKQSAHSTKVISIICQNGYQVFIRPWYYIHTYLTTVCMLFLPYYPFTLMIYLTLLMLRLVSSKA